MALELVHRYPFWSNAGSAAITGLASGSAIYFAPRGTSVAAGAAGSWAKIPTCNADRCIINYRVKMSNWGGATVSSGTTRISAIGCPIDHSDSDLDSLYPTSASPETTWLAASTHKDGMAMLANGWGHDLDIKAAVSDLTIVDQGIFPNGLHATATAGGGWTVSLGTWTPFAADVDGGYAGYDQPLVISGLDHIHLAISTFTTLTTATLANIRAKAALDVLFYKEVMDVYLADKSLRTRPDLKVNVSPY